ncbi:MAG: hypothetical protein QXM98_04610, partial [Thermoproteota archaeon]
MSILPFHPWLLLYPITAIIAFVISLRIIRSGPKTLSSKNFLFFTLTLSLWEIFAFLHRIAPDEYLSKLFFHIGSLFLVLNPLLLLMSILFLWKEDPRFQLLMIPSIPLYILHLLFSNIKVIKTTEYGWSYTFELNIFSIINYLAYFLCLILICLSIVFLITRVRSSIIRRKYIIILVYFVLFYVFGVFGLNILLSENPNMPPPGGINIFLFFLGVSYAFSLREKASLKLGNKKIKDLLLEQYASFIKKFIEVAPGKELGQSLIELERYLARVGLKDMLEHNSEGTLILKPDILEKANLVTIMEGTISYLEDKPWALELVHSLLPVLNTVYANLENKNEFRRIIIYHEDFLKKTDMIYALAGGEFLSEIGEDNSLKNLPNWQACLRLFRRLVSMILQDFYNIVGDAIESKILSFSLLNRLKISRLGQVEIEGVEEAIKNMPQNERIPALLDNFIPLIAWMIEEIYKKIGGDIEDLIKRLRIALKLDMDVAIKTMIYSNLVESLSGRIPSEYVSMLKLAEGFTLKDLTKFSSKINLDHNELIGKGILLEFEPKSTYLEYIRDYVVEALAHGGLSIVLTRKGSSLQDKLQDLRSIRFIHPSLMTLRTTSISDFETHVPLQDVVQILESLGRSVKSSSSPVFIVFDGLTDFVTQHGFEKTYKLIRSMLELAPSKVSL